MQRAAVRSPKGKQQCKAQRCFLFLKRRASLGRAVGEEQGSGRGVGESRSTRVTWSWHLCHGAPAGETVHAVRAALAVAIGRSGSPRPGRVLVFVGRESVVAVEESAHIRALDKSGRQGLPGTRAAGALPMQQPRIGRHRPSVERRGERLASRALLLRWRKGAESSYCRAGRGSLAVDVPRVVQLHDVLALGRPERSRFVFGNAGGVADDKIGVWSPGAAAGERNLRVAGQRAFATDRTQPSGRRRRQPRSLVAVDCAPRPGRWGLDPIGRAPC